MVVMKFLLWHSKHTLCMCERLSSQLGRCWLIEANKYHDNRSPTSCVVPFVPKPLIWHKAQVAAGKSVTVRLPASASQFQVEPMVAYRMPWADSWYISHCG